MVAAKCSSAEPGGPAKGPVWERGCDQGGNVGGLAAERVTLGDRFGKFWNQEASRQAFKEEATHTGSHLDMAGGAGPGVRGEQGGVCGVTGVLYNQFLLWVQISK